MRLDDAAAEVDTTPAMNGSTRSPRRPEVVNPYRSIVGALRTAAARRDAAAVLAERRSREKPVIRMTSPR